MDTHFDADAVRLGMRLFDLARGGRTAELLEYVTAGVPVDLANDRGDTLLMLASYNGNLETTRALLAAGADADRANDRGQTPLAGAVFKDEIEIARVLLAAGADPRAGVPSAVDTARMFERTALLAELEGDAPVG